MVDPKKAGEPGPGQYNPDISAMRPQSAGGRIGKELRKEMGGGKGKKDWPGPGQHDLENSIVQPGKGYSFGSSQR